MECFEVSCDCLAKCSLIKLFVFDGDESNYYYLQHYTSTGKCKNKYPIVELTEVQLDSFCYAIVNKCKNIEIPVVVDKKKLRLIVTYDEESREMEILLVDKRDRCYWSLWIYDNLEKVIQEVREFWYSRI